MHRSFLSSLILVTAACGGGGGFEEDLEPEVVTNLPAGDGTGTGVTGTFAVEAVTTGCAGDCVLDGSGDLGDGESDVMSVCDVGIELTQVAHVEQDGGALDIDVEESEYVGRLSGGIYADSSFEVGGYVTQNGGEVEVTSRQAGTISSETLTGIGRLQVRGGGMDCLIEVDLSGTRQGVLD